MRRGPFVFVDDHWSLIEPLLPGKASDCGVTAKDNGFFLEGVFWRVRVGGPLRDLPTGFGDWINVCTRSGVCDRILKLYPAIVILNTT